MSSEELKKRRSFYGKQAVVESLLIEMDLQVDNFELKIEAYKAEKVLEVFLRDVNANWKKVRSYPFCTFSGTLGPKIREGDRQIPEGIYKVAVFNPQSKFYLSLGLDYPNKRDMLIADPNAPGSDIYIHGGCSSVGCIAITDEKIAELFMLAKSANEDIPVIILPFKQSEAKRQKYYKAHPKWEKFWEKLFVDVESMK